MGINENQIVRYEYNNKIIVGEERMPKFDVVVGNPPYLGKTYFNFLNLAVNLCKGQMYMIHPSTLYIKHANERKQKREIEFLNTIKSTYTEIDLIDYKKYFNIAALLPLAITYIDKTKDNNNKIKIIDKLHGLPKNYEYDDLNKINLYGDIPEYFSLKEKILYFCKNVDNLKKHVNEIVNSKDLNYYVNLSVLRGNVHAEQLHSDDFYTFVPKNLEVEINITKKLYFIFNKKENACNFLNYLKTNFARFSLSLFKIDMNLNMGEIQGTPWLDFTQEWTDEKLYKYFDLSKEEINFIETNIPKYYE